MLKIPWWFIKRIRRPYRSRGAADGGWAMAILEASTKRGTMQLTNPMDPVCFSQIDSVYTLPPPAMPIRIGPSRSQRDGDAVARGWSRLD